MRCAFRVFYGHLGTFRSYVGLSANLRSSFNEISPGSRPLPSVARFHEPLILPCAALAAGILAAHYARFDGREIFIVSYAVYSHSGRLLLPCRPTYLAGLLVLPRCHWNRHGGVSPPSGSPSD